MAHLFGRGTRYLAIRIEGETHPKFLKRNEKEVRFWDLDNETKSKSRFSKEKKIEYMGGGGVQFRKGHPIT